MPDYKFCVSLLGQLKMETCLPAYVENIRAPSDHCKINLLRPDAVQWAIDDPHAPERLKKIAADIRRNESHVRRRIENATQLHILIDSHGGDIGVQWDVQHLMAQVQANAGMICAYVPGRASSMAANIASAGDVVDIHTLPTSRFLWHLPQQTDSDQRRLASKAGFGSVEELQRDWMIRQRMQLAQIFGYFGAKMHQNPRWQQVCGRIIDTFYSNQEEGGKELWEIAEYLRSDNEVGRSRFEDRAHAFHPFHRQDATFQVTGAELGDWGVARVHPDIAALARAFQERSGWRVQPGSIDSRWDFFFQYARVFAEARARAIAVSYDLSERGEISLISDTTDPGEQRALRDIHKKYSP